MDAFLRATEFVESDHPEVVRFSRGVVSGASDDVERSIRLYYAVRDGIRYDPYSISDDAQRYRASDVLSTGSAYCIPKAVLFCAAARAAGIPCALGFADVKNHLNTEKLRRLMGTDLFVYHGYAAVRLGDRWVKVTPAFNIELCERFGVRPLEFDGSADSLMHPYDEHDRRHMEYVADHGMYEDFPFDEVMEAFDDAYPGFMQQLKSQRGARFENERPLA